MTMSVVPDLALQRPAVIFQAKAKAKASVIIYVYHLCSAPIDRILGQCISVSMRRGSVEGYHTVL